MSPGTSLFERFSSRQSYVREVFTEEALTKPGRCAGIIVQALWKSIVFGVAEGREDCKVQVLV